MYIIGAILFLWLEPFGNGKQKSKLVVKMMSLQKLRTNDIMLHPCC